MSEGPAAATENKTLVAPSQTISSGQMIKKSGKTLDHVELLCPVAEATDFAWRYLSDLFLHDPQLVFHFVFLSPHMFTHPTIYCTPNQHMSQPWIGVNIAEASINSVLQQGDACHAH